ncbi:hypothetical protein [Phormidium sp. CCY1219]|uniref:hypothetical protein n=1 Tax=Phormidium sp. CCY1219 TaxID=2886104 RepID=UPI002D1E6AD5|nr:hypothetical protein [Phormidium sp. CCY1219]MEB3828688.1 hypothetical protein [Phormidium sp. CCY1219]
MVFASQSRAVAGKCPLLIRQSSQRKTASKSRFGERLKLELENTERFGEQLKLAREFKAQKKGRGVPIGNAQYHQTIQWKTKTEAIAAMEDERRKQGDG